MKLEKRLINLWVLEGVSSIVLLLSLFIEVFYFMFAIFIITLIFLKLKYAMELIKNG